VVRKKDRDQLDKSCDRYIISAAKRRKANWTGHILRSICHIKHIIDNRRINIYERNTRKKM